MRLQSSVVIMESLCFVEKSRRSCKVVQNAGQAAKYKKNKKLY